MKKYKYILIRGSGTVERFETILDLKNELLININECDPIDECSFFEIVKELDINIKIEVKDIGI